MTDSEIRMIKNISDCVGGISHKLEFISNEIISISESVSENKAMIDVINEKISKKPEFLSVGEVAIKMGVCERTVRNKIKSGDIHAFKNSRDKSYQIPSKEFYNNMKKVKSLSYVRNNT